MAKQRSPNYPGISLDSALELAKALYKREGRGAVAPEIAAKAWGYSALHGVARSRLGTLRQYGLIDSDATGNVRLTARGLSLAVGNSGSTGYAVAIREAALAPDVFRELFDGKKDASDDSLRHHLIVVKKFSEEGAQRLIVAYRATLRTADLDGEGYDEVEDDEAGIEGEDQRGSFGDGAGAASGSSGRGIPKVGVHRYSWPLPPKITAELSFYGGEPNASHITQLITYLSFFKESLASATDSIE